MIKELIRYCHYDPATFEVVGFYSNKVHKEIPNPSVVVTLEDINAFNAGQMTHVTVVDGAFAGFTKVDTLLTPTEELELSRGKRSKAYSNEADRLFMEWQYDQNPASEAVWRAKVLEIKNRYPIV